MYIFLPRILIPQNTSTPPSPLYKANNSDDRRRIDAHDGGDRWIGDAATGFFQGASFSYCPISTSRKHERVTQFFLKDKSKKARI